METQLLNYDDYAMKWQSMKSNIFRAITYFFLSCIIQFETIVQPDRLNLRHRDTDIITIINPAIEVGPLVNTHQKPTEDLLK